MGFHWLGLILSVLIIYSFLKDWGITVTAILVIPVTVLITLVAMWMVGSDDTRRCSMAERGQSGSFPCQRSASGSEAVQGVKCGLAGTSMSKTAPGRATRHTSSIQ